MTSTFASRPRTIFTSAKAIAFLCVILIGLASCKDEPKEAVQGAIITSFVGTLEITPPAGAKFSFKPDMLFTKKGILLPGSIIQTGKDSTTDLQFASSVLMRLGANTKAKLEGAQILTGEGFTKVLFRLDKGRALTKTDKLTAGSSVKIVTPTATASVRGTEFMVKEEEEASTTLVSEGSVEVSDSSNENSEVVEEGNKANISETGELILSTLDETDTQELGEMAQGLSGISEDGAKRIQEILQTFEENKELIKKAVEAQKLINAENLQEQLEKNKDLLDTQNLKNQETLEKAKKTTEDLKKVIQGDSKEKKGEALDKAKSELDKLKGNLP